MVATTIPGELLDEAERAAEERVRGLTVLDAEFVRVTAWWGGGPHGETLDVPTPSSIVGRVRWFIRTVYNRFCARDLSKYEESMAFVDGFLGSIAGASRYRFSVQPVGSGGSAGRDPGRGAQDDLGYVPRVRLYNMGGERRDGKSEPRLNVAPFRLTISGNPGIDGHHDELVAGATLLTMAYVGVGKAASRGFGRFYPRRVDGDGLVPRIARAIRGGRPEEAFGLFYGLGGDLCGGGGPRPNPWRNSHVPLAPRVDCDGEDCIFTVQRDDARHWDEVKALDVVGNCFMKNTWKRSRGSLSNCDHLRGALDTGGRIQDYVWIFGLPRNAKAPNNRSVSTGYFLDGVDPGRRTSTVIASPFLSLNDGDQPLFRGILLLPFLSLDDHLMRAGKLRIRGGRGEIKPRPLFRGEVDAERLGDGIAEAVRALRCICESRGGYRGPAGSPRGWQR